MDYTRFVVYLRKILVNLFFKFEDVKNTFDFTFVSEDFVAGIIREPTINLIKK